MAEPRATWVYAVVPATVAGPPAGVTGVADEPVRLVAEAGVAAVVGSVSRREVAEEPLRQHLRDPVWLERAARRHHEVVTACFQRAPTAPFRLATVYHSDARVRRLLGERGPELRAVLDSVTGRAEWGVQVATARLAPPAAPSTTGAAGSTGVAGTATGAAPPATGAAATTGAAAAVAGAGGTAVAASAGAGRRGTDYLLRRRAERDARERARRAALDAAGRVDEVLAGLAVTTRRLTPPVAETGDDAPVVFNAAYLVDDARAEEFVRAVRALGDQLPGARVRATGPWPAYSFVEIGAVES
jgi:hypothetical protein